MIWLLLVLLLLCGGCLEAREPYAAPAAVELRPSPPAEGGLRVVQRLDLGGAATDVVADGRSVYVATPAGVDRHDTPGAPPAERIVLPGTPRRLWLQDDELWVALGRGGVARVRRPGDPGDREIDVWPTGGWIEDVVPDEGGVWVADETGRVLLLDPVAGPDTPPEELYLDGWPQQVSPGEGGVLVAAEYGGLRAVARGPDGSLVEVEPPLDLVYASTVAGDADGLWISTYFQIVRHTDRGTRRLDHPHASWRAIPTGGGVLLPARGEGVLAWDGEGEELVQHQLGLPGTGVTAEPVGLAVAGDDAVVIAAGKAGVVWADTGSTPWAVSGWHAPGGGLRALEPHGEGAVAVVSDDLTSSAVVLLERDAVGGLEVADRIPAPPGISGVVAWDDRLLLAGEGLYTADLTEPAGRRRVEALPLTADKIAALVPLPRGRAAAIAGAAEVLWLASDGTGTWSIEASSKADQEWMPIALAAHDDIPAVAYAGHGRLKLFPEPGGEPLPQHLLDGEAAFNEGAPLRPAGIASDGQRIWVAIPFLGMEGVDPRTGEHTTIRLDPGAWDVHPWGNRLAVALGTDGVAIVDPRPDGGRELARQALPGETWFVLPLGDQLLAGAGGSLYLLEFP